jgi:AcrR family transcriptional regulator
VRITAEAKRETRERIIAAARRLFREQGFEAATTRDLARAAGIAAGTLFNYFPSKESVVLDLVLDALERAAAAHEKRAEAHETLEEDLFALAAGSLRELRPLRGLVPAVLDASLGSTRCGGGAGEASCSPSARHVEAAGRATVRHGAGDAFSSVAQQLYWTLFTGVLTFWSRDGSPKQEDTLAYLDAALTMFVDWLTGESGPRRRRSPRHAPQEVRRST